MEGRGRLWHRPRPVAGGPEGALPPVGQGGLGKGALGRERGAVPWIVATATPGLAWGAMGGDLGPGSPPRWTQQSGAGPWEAGGCFQQSFVRLLAVVHVLTGSLML